MEPLIIDINDPQIWESLQSKEVKKNIFVSPTDTVYGLGTLFSNMEGVERILKIKERGEAKFIVLARNINEVLELATMTAVQEIIAKRYWPGSISFIFQSKKFPSSTIAVRVPMDPFLQKLLKALGGPILSTSCNLHGSSPVKSVPEAIKLFGDQVDFYVDGGTKKNALVSTLVDLTLPKPTVIRQGAVTFP